MPDTQDFSPVPDPRLRPPSQPVLPLAQGATQPAPTPIAPAGFSTAGIDNATPAIPKAQPSAPAPSGPTAIQQYATQLGQKGSGISNIHNPILKTLATIGDVVAGTFAPRAEQLIPGTEGNYALHLARAGNAVAGEREGVKAQGEQNLQSAQALHSQAQARLANTQADVAEEESKKNVIALGPNQGAYDLKANKWLVEPTAKDEEKVTEVDPEIGKQLGIVPTKDGRFMVPNQALGSLLKKKEPVEGEMPLGERIPQLNQALTSRYQVLHPKEALPPQFTIPANATQKDYDRIDKGLEAEERAIGTKEQQAQTNEMRRQTMALAAQNAQNRQDTAVRTAGFKAYTPALDSAERFNVMAKNYEDAVKNHDQQAMLSLLANHIGMTMGLQKGARLTKDIIHEAEVSRPWLQGLQAKFDKDGYLTGVNLTPQQMQQMVSLGRERFSEDVTKARSEAAYQGVKDEGPARIPNRSTINHYTALANGDVKKAKELAAADGWTVQ